MDRIHLRAIDLNLLVVLDVLLDERHVTRAAARLGLSQSATSNALERLRALLGDPLLERAAKGMRATPRAEALRAPLREALGEISRIVVSAGADLTTIRQTVRLSVVDYGIALLVPALCKALAESAPGLDLVVLPWTGADQATRDLASGALDLAITVVAPGAGALRFRHLFHERYLVTMRREHPSAGRFDLEAWLGHPHVVVSGRGETAGALDATLAERGLHRRVSVVVPSFLAVPQLLATSDLFALLPEQLLTTLPEGSGLITRPPPVAVPGFEVGIAWHPRRDGDVAVGHVREQIARITSGFDARPAKEPSRKGLSRKEPSRKEPRRTRAT